MVTLSTDNFTKSSLGHLGAVSCFQPVAVANDSERKSDGNGWDCGVSFALRCQALKAASKYGLT